jgi:hypothetical protein
VTFGAAGFFYGNTEGFYSFHDPDDSYGNGVDSLGRYVSDYKLVEAYAELAHKLNRLPVVVMADLVSNTATDSLGLGWLIGVRVGKTREPGSWAFHYIYRRVEADAVIGVFTDSDFRGGGTDAKGHEVGGSLRLAENTSFNITFFDNKIGLGGAETGFRRLQVDLQLQFP